VEVIVFPSGGATMAVELGEPSGKSTRVHSSNLESRVSHSDVGFERLCQQKKKIQDTRWGEIAGWTEEAGI
jgi:hypothetical protein